MLFADLALAQRLERNEALNIADCVPILQRHQPGTTARLLPVADGYAVFTRPDFPINRAMALGLCSSVSAADLDAIEEFYGGYGLPAKLDLCPLADRSLVDEVGERGYRFAMFFNVQIRPILREDADLAPSPGIRVAAVTPDDAELWAMTMARSGAVQEPVDPEDTWLALARVVTQRPGVTCFLAWIGDEVVGGAALMIREGLATFFSTTTLPPYRGRGVQTALVRARLAFAARAGCDLVTVSTVPGNQSQRNMQRAGFQVVYTRIIMVKDLT